MQNTALIYGLAASTLVGAFVLVPRSPPEPARPDAPPPDAFPVTELVYTDGTVEVTARLDRGLVMPGNAEPVWLELGIKALGAAVRAPLMTVLVVDRSGSMAGDKIDAARIAAERFVLGLRPSDALGVVSFGSDVKVDLPLAQLDESTRVRALSAVRGLDEGGGTNIDGALEAARRMLAAASLSGRVGRVVLISDGRPTEGDRSEDALARHAMELRQAGITMSTLGLGLDYNEDLMERLAVDGGGRFHHLRHAEQLGKILDDEFKHAASVVASGVRVFLPTAPAGLEFIDAPGSKLTRGSRRVVDVGDLAVSEERHVLVKLAPAPGSTWRQGHAIAAPEVTYKRALSSTDALVAHRSAMLRLLVAADAAQADSSRRDDVRIRILQVEASLALTESMHALAAGDAGRARESLQKKKADLEMAANAMRSPSIAAEAANIGKVLDTVTAAPADSSDMQDVIKTQKARAFHLRR